MSVATSQITAPQQPVRVRWARAACQVLAWLFLAGIGVQVFLAGLGIFVAAPWWLQHRSFVHGLEALPLLMLILAFAGQLSGILRWGTVAAFGLIGVQYATIELDQPVFAALHPVNAIVLSLLALIVIQRSARLSTA
jgi:mercuric ion transport protein